MTATTDTLPYGTASTVRTCHYGGDLKYGAWAVLRIGEDKMTGWIAMNEIMTEWTIKKKST